MREVCSEVLSTKLVARMLHKPPLHHVIWPRKEVWSFVILTIKQSRLSRKQGNFKTNCFTRNHDNFTKGFIRTDVSYFHCGTWVDAQLQTCLLSFSWFQRKRVILCNSTGIFWCLTCFNNNKYSLMNTKLTLAVIYRCRTCVIIQYWPWKEPGEKMRSLKNIHGRCRCFHLCWSDHDICLLLQRRQTCQLFSRCIHISLFYSFFAYVDYTLSCKRNCHLTKCPFFSNFIQFKTKLVSSLRQVPKQINRS